MATASEDEIAAGPVGHPSRKMLGSTGAAKVARDPGGESNPGDDACPCPPTPRLELFPMDIGRLRIERQPPQMFRLWQVHALPILKLGPTKSNVSPQTHDWR
jgi:hypothetical protein